MTKPPPRLRLRVTAAAESIVRSRHPWLFADSIREQNREGETGELAVIYDRQDKFLAVGLFDPDSPIRVRILHAGKPATIDDAWWRERLGSTMARRAGLLDATTNAGRLIHGESDGWPGLVLDRYDTTVVLKLYSAAWLPRLDEVLGWIRHELSPGQLVLRLSRNIQDVARSRFQRVEGWLAAGTTDDKSVAVSNPVVFQETGLRFEADVIKGQKTGFFLDQRENRRRVEGLATGRDVLNAFSFSGGFSLYAARGGAKSVTDLDISVHALESARRNFALNQSLPTNARCPHETIQADAFQWLERNRDRRFDLIVLDPPSLARREAERAGAIQAYGALAGSGIRALRPGGILVAASCSAHVSSGEFFGAVRAAAGSSLRTFEELDTTGHPPDHPAIFPEARYLKCIYLRS
jgi:23S rRNA (cytosine1962-C5)-methyltransferase